jgi:NAD(P)H dehydrogenase (quinone)
MNILIVLAHPELKSFNGAMADTAKRTLEAAGHTVAFSDLYRMGFNPVSDRYNFLSVKDPEYLKLQVEESYASEQNAFAPELEEEIRKIESCDLMIFQFPLWWFGLPAILKGWVDRVMAMGRTWGNGNIYNTGRFRGKRALLSLTTGGPDETYLKGGFNGDIHAILRPIQRGIFQFLGFDVLAPQIHYAPVRASEETRRSWLADWEERLLHISDESLIDVGIY